MGAGQLGGAPPHGTGPGAPLREALRTARLDLRLFDHGDVPELHEILADPATNTIGNGPLRSPAETRAWVERRQRTFAEHGLVWYAVRLRTTGRLLGHCGILPGRPGNLASRHIVEQLGLRLHHVTTDDRGELLFYDLALLPTEPCR